MHPLRVSLATAAIFIVTLVFGCTKRSPQNESATPTRLPDVLSYAEPTVGKSDPLVNAIGPTLAPWAILWRHAYPGFEADSLIPAGTAPAFRAGEVQPLQPPPKENAAAFRILSAKSPDGRFDLIFDGYQCISESDGELEIGGEPDSAPLLLDLKRRTSNRFDFCGPGICAFHWGAWVSPTRFVLAGTQYDDKSMGIRGRVQVYSLSDSTVSTYVTRPLHSSRAEAYTKAWESWVALRYRATKQIASRS